MEIQDFNIRYNPSDTKPCIIQNVYIYVCDTRCTFVGFIFMMSSAWKMGENPWHYVSFNNYKFFWKCFSVTLYTFVLYSGNYTINHYTSGPIFLPPKIVLFSDSDSDWWMKLLIECCDVTWPQSVTYRTILKVRTLFVKINIHIHETWQYLLAWENIR
jgi:hypothetical protein